MYNTFNRRVKMADRNKFEHMLELLVNEDKDAAEKLFHEIVVEKSRDIYEGLLEDDKDVDEASDEEVEEASKDDDEDKDDAVDEASDEEVEEDDDEEVKENFDLDEFEVEADPMDVGGDATDELEKDLDGDSDDDDDAPEGDVEDRVEDLEDALDDLKAEFEKMMSGDEGEDDGEEADDDAEGGEEDDAGMPDLGMDDETEESAGEEPFQATITPLSAGEQMREYVEKVSAKMGDNGANTKSSVAGSNNMGGTAGNLVQGTEESGGEHAGLGDMNAKDQDGGNVNVPGGKASKSLKAAPGHGAEKKGKPEAAADKSSLIGSK